jgi:uncharacterized cofD-like protein
MNKPKKRIVIFGGGSGTRPLLEGLSRQDGLEISVIVAMADDGGSTGRLRRDLGIPPVGDIRSCLLSLAPGSDFKNALMHRFSDGDLTGHNAGNILLTALAQSGDLETGIDELAHMLNVTAQVIPVTLDDMVIVMNHGDQRTVGEDLISETNLDKPRKLTLQKSAQANKKAIEAIEKADLIILSAGSLYESLISHFLVDGIKKAVSSSSLPLIYNCNITNKPGHTDGYTVQDFVHEIESYLGKPLDAVTYHNKSIPEEMNPKKREQVIVSSRESGHTAYLGGDLLSNTRVEQQGHDAIKRANLIHDPEALVNLILSYEAGDRS